MTSGSERFHTSVDCFLNYCQRLCSLVIILLAERTQQYDMNRNYEPCSSVILEIDYRTKP
jgi:hypothetical protein